MNDHDLLQKAINNDQAALAELHDRFYPHIWRYVKYRVPDEQITDDIVSEVFMSLLAHIHQQKKNIKNLRGWLMGTANHLVTDYWRDQYRKPVEPIDGKDFEADTIHPEKRVEENLRMENIRQLFGKLTDDQQHVIALRFSLELSLEETAQAMQKTVGSVKLLQYRAVAALRQHLDQRGWS